MALDSVKRDLFEPMGAFHVVGRNDTKSLTIVPPRLRPTEPISERLVGVVWILRQMRG